MISNLQNWKKTEEVTPTITLGYMKYKSKFYGLGKKKSKLQETIVLHSIEF